MNIEEQLKWLEKEYIPACKKAGKYVAYEYSKDDGEEWHLNDNDLGPLLIQNTSYRLPPPPKKTVNINGVEYVAPSRGPDLPDGVSYMAYPNEKEFAVEEGDLPSSRRFTACLFFEKFEDCEAWVKMLNKIHGVGG